MVTYSVEITWQGRCFSPLIQARSASDAIAIVKQQYPGCGVFRASVVG